MSLEVLAEVRKANEAAREEESARAAERAGKSPECPAYPLEGWYALDTTVGTPGMRRR